MGIPMGIPMGTAMGIPVGMGGGLKCHPHGSPGNFRWWNARHRWRNAVPARSGW